MKISMYNKCNEKGKQKWSWSMRWMRLMKLDCFEKSNKKEFRSFYQYETEADSKDI